MKNENILTSVAILVVIVLISIIVFLPTGQPQTITVEQAVKDRHFAWEEGYRYGAEPRRIALSANRIGR